MDGVDLYHKKQKINFFSFFFNITRLQMDGVALAHKQLKIIGDSFE
jgi:hypothetical protein